MQILLTGHCGRLGPATAGRLRADGHEVRGFDIADGDDIMDAAAIRRAARGIDAIVHSAGMPEDRNAPPADTLAINLAGTSNTLVAAELEGVKRVVFLSSGKSLGMLERDPDYLPLDDDHRGLATRPYGLSKWLAEEMCGAFTTRTGITTICLRPVAVFDDAGYARTMQSPPAPTPPGRSWHMGVHVHVEDVAAAIAKSVACQSPPHARLLICPGDIRDPRPTRELVAQHLPKVPWRGGAEYKSAPFRSLIDIERARRVLGWEPRPKWPGRGAP